MVTCEDQLVNKIFIKINLQCLAVILGCKNNKLNTSFLAFPMNQIQKSDLPTPQSKRIFKFKTKIQSKFQTSLLSIHLPKPYITNTHLHVPGKINFHELLSLPLEKQIQKQNSLKQNQTFCLKFEPDLSQRQNNKIHSRQNLHKVTNKNSKFLNRKNLTTEKGARLKKSHENEQFQQIKNAAKTMYFKPIGKIARNYENENHERRSLQFTKNIKNMQNPKIEIGANVYKDKLMMLLQIRKQERNERKSQSVLENGSNSYRQITKLSATEGFKEKYDQYKSYQSYRRKMNEESGVKPKFKRSKYEKKQAQDMANPSQLSPWYLMENGQEF